MNKTLNKHMILIIFIAGCHHVLIAYTTEICVIKLIYMEYRLTNHIGSIHAEELYNFSTKTRSTIFTRFAAWCEAQEANYFFWLAFSFFAQIGLTLPLTALFIIFFGGNNFVLWTIVAAINVPVLVLNLAAFPTKIKLPFLFFGWFTQAVIIIYCIGFAIIY
jgi:hypothetical protein